MPASGRPAEAPARPGFGAWLQVRLVPKDASWRCRSARGPHGLVESHPWAADNGRDVTPDIVIGRLPVSKTLDATFGVGYESAPTPSFRAKPLTPSFNHGVVATTHISF